MHSGFSALRNDCTMNVGVRVTPKPPSGALRLDIARLRELFGEGLSRFGGPYLAGANLTAVDAFLAPVAFRIRTYGLDVGAGQAWVDHMLKHPAMVEWERQALFGGGRVIGREWGRERWGASVGNWVGDSTI